MIKPNHSVEPEELIAYLDGELPAEEALDTAAHLEHCRECQKLAAELKQVSEMLVGWQVEEAEAEPSDRIVKALDDRSFDKTSLNDYAWRGVLSPRHWPKPVWGLLAVGVILIVIVTSNRQYAPSMKTFYETRPGPQDSPRSPQPIAPNTRDTAIAKLQQTVPSATPGPSAGSVGKIRSEIVNGKLTLEQSDVGVEEAQESAVDNAVDLKGPMIIRTADLAVIVKNDEFDKARAAIDEILRRHHGHVGVLNVTNPEGSARSLTGTLRVPSSRLDAALADFKSLGRVEKESQGGEEITQQYVDLQARLANSKHTEQQLTEILRQRTGKLSDVLAVEMQISRVRGEIEQMEAQRKTMKNQVDFATLNLTVTQDYKKELSVAPPSTSTQFRNAAVDGYRAVVDGIIALLLWLLAVGPTLLLWAAILFFPVRKLWRKVKPRLAKELTP